MRHIHRMGIIAVVALACGASAAGADSTAARCEAGKNHVVGKYAACLHKAEARLAKAKGMCVSFPAGETCYSNVDCQPWLPEFDVCQKDRTDYDAAVGKCTATFEERWAKLAEKALDKNGACPDTWQFVDVRDEVSADVAASVARSTHVLSGKPRFITQSGDGTIFDGENGLTWERKVRLDDEEDYANLHDADNRYPWGGICSTGGVWCQPDAQAAALCLELVEGNPEGCATCPSGTCTVGANGTTVWQWLAALRAANFAGHADWRLPTRAELVSIVDYRAPSEPVTSSAFHASNCGATCGDVTDPYCACTYPYTYISASAPLHNEHSAWVVAFDHANIFFTSKAYRCCDSGISGWDCVRAVRGGR